MGGIISETFNGTSISSITVKRMAGGVIFLSPDLVNQLKNQGLVPVVTAVTTTTVTISFYKPPSAQVSTVQVPSLITPVVQTPPSGYTPASPTLVNAGTTSTTTPPSNGGNPRNKPF